MGSNDASSCAFLTTSKDHPLHLVDAYDGSLRCSYRPYNHLDELSSASCVTFNPNGSLILASGFRNDRSIQVFRTELPGRDAEIWKLGKTRHSSDGQKGMVSTISFPSGPVPVINVFAVGTCSPGSIYIYDDRSPTGIVGNIILSNSTCVAEGKWHTREISSRIEDDFLHHARSSWFQRVATRCGVKQIMWSNDGLTLFSASRKSNAVLSWDVRKLSDPTCGIHMSGLAAYSRDGDTNQTLEFDLVGNKFIFVASRDNSVKIYDVKSTKHIGSIESLSDVPNGVSLKQFSDGSLLAAVATGTRRFDDLDVEEDVDQGKNKIRVPGTLEMFKINIDQL